MGKKKWFIAITDEMVLKVREDAFDLPNIFLKRWEKQLKLLNKKKGRGGEGKR